MRLLLEGKRQTAIRAHQQGNLIISWGNLEQPEHLENVARRNGWHMPTSSLTGWLIDIARHRRWRSPDARLKDAFLAKMFENDKNFDSAVRNDGIDIYLANSERV